MDILFIKTRVFECVWTRPLLPPEYSEPLKCIIPYLSSVSDIGFCSSIFHFSLFRGALLFSLCNRCVLRASFSIVIHVQKNTSSFSLYLAECVWAKLFLFVIITWRVCVWPRTEISHQPLRLNVSEDWTHITSRERFTVSGFTVIKQ